MMARSNKGVISLLGCGWLGFPLAKSLVLQGFTVQASTSTEWKLEVFQKAGIDPYLVQFSEAVSLLDLNKFFKADILIITIPPGRRDPSGLDNYRMMVEYICQKLPTSTVSKLIFISSTSVYADTNDIKDEFSVLDPESESGQLLADTENTLSNLNINMIILRFAGLIGPGRMPGKFFAGKKNLPNGLAPVNLIHLEDAIGIINLMINNRTASGVYNGCAPSHPSKQEFYSLAAQVEGLEKPDFILEKTNWKIISSVRLSTELKYQFVIPSLIDWVNSLKNA